MLPLTYSIANGMGAGVLSYAILKPAALWADRKAAQQAAVSGHSSPSHAAGLSRMSPFVTGAPAEDPFKAADQYAAHGHAGVTMRGSGSGKLSPAYASAHSHAHSHNGGAVTEQSTGYYSH